MLKLNTVSIIQVIIKTVIVIVDCVAVLFINKNHSFDCKSFIITITMCSVYCVCPVFSWNNNVYH